MGKVISISRRILRATTASLVSRPPSRAATRRPSTRLPGVAPRGPSSNSRNQTWREANITMIHTTTSAWLAGLSTLMPAARAI
jgi:hypothetical protein